ncbi:hypothetical protein M9458_039633, partial [Cirrhinus mrigala]
ALKGPPFEPLLGSDLRPLTLKAALLLALASVKRMGDLQALSVNLSCLEFGPGDSKVIERSSLFASVAAIKDIRWIVDAITLAYSSLGLRCSIGVRAHSTRGMASSWAWSSGVSIAEICAATDWASPSTFTRFYNLGVPTLQAR